MVEGAKHIELEKHDVRCPNCEKKLCEAYGDVVLKVICSRCKTPYTFPKEVN